MAVLPLGRRFVENRQDKVAALKARLGDHASAAFRVGTCECKKWLLRAASAGLSIPYLNPVLWIEVDDLSYRFTRCRRCI